jgi:hypothetical protein
MAGQRPAPMTKKGNRPKPSPTTRPAGNGDDRRPPQHTRNRKRRPGRLWFWLVFVAALALIGVVVFVVSNNSSKTAGGGPEGAPVVKAAALAPSGATGEPIDGISCAPTESLAYHIHVHLAIYVDGQPKQVPPGLGMTPPVKTQTAPGGDFATGGTCLYWIHTHAGDGIVHVESPKEVSYTLGNVFDIWHQPLSSDQVGPAKGKVTVFVNGKQQTEQPQLIILDPHAVIQLDVGTVVPPKSFTFPGTL